MVSDRDRIWFEIESGALRILFSRDRREHEPTQKQLTALNSLVSKGLAQAKRRHAVLGEITRLELESTYQLPAGTASILIDYLKMPGEDWVLSPAGARLLRVAEAMLEDDDAGQEAVLQAHALEIPDIS